jgi:hypothetical protein
VFQVHIDRMFIQQARMVWDIVTTVIMFSSQNREFILQSVDWCPTIDRQRNAAGPRTEMRAYDPVRAGKLRLLAVLRLEHVAHAAQKVLVRNYRVPLCTISHTVRSRAEDRSIIKTLHALSTFINA